MKKSTLQGRKMHVFKNFSGQKNGRAKIVACLFGPKSERAAARPVQ